MKPLCLFQLVAVGALVAVEGSALGQAAKALPPAAPGKIDFRADIEVIFKKHCLECHGAGKQRGGLRLDAGALARKGSNSGPVIVPGNAAKSRLLEVVAGFDEAVLMPPKGRTPLATAEIAKLRAWIEQGATWPEGTAAIAATKSSHWAFQPIVRHPLPNVKNKN